MKLRDYFKKKRIDPVAFAVESGISVTSIYRYMKGRKPHRKTAYKIEELTGGEVTVEDLLPTKWEFND